MLQRFQINAFQHRRRYGCHSNLNAMLDIRASKLSSCNGDTVIVNRTTTEIMEKERKQIVNSTKN